MLLAEKNPLFESLTNKLEDYPELKEMIYRLLFFGDTISFNILNPVIDVACMFGFVKDAGGKLAIANRIFETVLNNLLTSEEELGSRLFAACQRLVVLQLLHHHFPHVSSSENRYAHRNEPISEHNRSCHT